MKNKTSYVGMIVIGLILIGVLGVGVKSLVGNIVNEIPLNNNIPDSELQKYRLDSIPEECRLPEGNDNVQSWTEHLSHHENTLYCLDYYN